MHTMKIITVEKNLDSPGESSIHDLTPMLRSVIEDSGLQEGQALVFVPGSTAAITAIEYEPGLVADIPAALEKVAPRHGAYRHHETWHDDNGSSHVRAALIGPSETIPFSNTDGLAPRACDGCSSVPTAMAAHVKPANVTLVKRRCVERPAIGLTVARWRTHPSTYFELDISPPPPLRCRARLFEGAQAQPIDQLPPPAA